MIPRPTSLAVEQRVGRSLQSYSNLHKESAVELIPKTEKELSEIFDYALSARRRVTIRGGGHAFHDQSLGRDLVVSMEQLESDLIQVDARERQVTVGAGVKWGRVVRELNKHRLVLPGTVTTSHATAGGTLASDCLSRFSPSCGKEGSRVKSFKLMTVNGEARTYKAPIPGGGHSKLAERTFLGAISGFGYIGAFLEITYRVIPFPKPAATPSAGASGPTRVRTVLSQHPDYSKLAEVLIPNPSPKDDTPHAAWAVLYPTSTLEDRTALVMESSLTTEAGGKRFLLFDPGDPRAKAAQFGPRVPAIYRTMAKPLIQQWTRVGEFFNELEGFLFFMDAHALASRYDKQIQQTFVVPCADKPQPRLESWLTRAHQQLKAHPGLRLLMVDVGYLPKDKLPFYLSPTAHGDGFAVSYAFGVVRPGEREEAQAALWEMSEILWNDFRGSVSLVKNVYASPRTLAEMYRGEVERFFELKRDLDPHGILCNDFLERAFPDRCRAAGYTARFHRDPHAVN